MSRSASPTARLRPSGENVSAVISPRCAGKTLVSSRDVASRTCKVPSLAPTTTRPSLTAIVVGSHDVAAKVGSPSPTIATPWVVAAYTFPEAAASAQGWPLTATPSDTYSPVSKEATLTLSSKPLVANVVPSRATAAVTLPAWHGRWGCLKFKSVFLGLANLRHRPSAVMENTVPSLQPTTGVSPTTANDEIGDCGATSFLSTFERSFARKLNDPSSETLSVVWPVQRTAFCMSPTSLPIVKEVTRGPSSEPCCHSLTVLSADAVRKREESSGSKAQE
mmetsp:Transcript_5923/g.18645  ORF Transcript_5923/g.18645 Transcript_5923/m.18645 type:complete len:278 (+) Transcript_5923:1229-2062(+)